MKMNEKEQENPYVLIEHIKNANSQQELESLTDALVNFGEDAVSVLLEKMPKLMKARLRMIGARVFLRVGYPANAKALNFMVSDVSNPNSATYEISLEALLKIGAPALKVIEDAIVFYSLQDAEGNSLEIGSLKSLKEQINKL